MAFNYHDALAKGKVHGAHPGGFYLTKRLLENIKLTKEMKVLDIGCGMGQTTLYIAETIGCQVVAVDKHPEMIHHLRQHAGVQALPIDIIEADIEELPFADEQFDLIVSESVIAFTKIEKSLDELRRALKQAGTFICNEMCVQEQMKVEELEQFKNLYQIQEILTKEEWLSKLKNAGFQNFTIIKDRKMTEELSEYADEEKMLDNGGTVVYSEDVEQILVEQSLLLMEYADKIGYMVIQAEKR
ncbi:class I SAM-dependent methyltransferase [Bacillus sp. SD088]|uniref:class I SAM-dependent methyltransferase n=1 Tax=Bacillus sp. SD088 TaxID=2782012 RepID=UPI001A969387|nr:methyltransferase domain-containing protein [Bacillus sp. SD088]MBO0992185.1 class I SAM-dependent methyltransferase [Bacillus sp. SD088]